MMPYDMRCGGRLPAVPVYPDREMGTERGGRDACGGALAEQHMDADAAVGGVPAVAGTAYMQRRGGDCAGGGACKLNSPSGIRAGRCPHSCAPQWAGISLPPCMSGAGEGEWEKSERGIRCLVS